MRDYGRFQTMNPKLTQCLDVAITTAGNWGTTLISGEIGSGRRLLAEVILDEVGTQRLKRWSQIQETQRISPEDVILVEELTTLTAEQHKKMTNLIQSSAYQTKWIIIADEDQLSLVDEGLLKMIQTFQLRVPSLSERKEDIPFLVQHFTSVFALIQGKACPKISVTALETLKSFPWYGNVTELEKVLEKAVQNCVSEIMPHHLFFEHRMAAPQPVQQTTASLADMEKKLILQTLEITQNNKTKAAEILGISIRTLRNKLNIYRFEGVQI